MRPSGKENKQGTSCVINGLITPDVVFSDAVWLRVNGLIRARRTRSPEATILDVDGPRLPKKLFHAD